MGSLRGAVTAVRRARRGQARAIEAARGNVETHYAYICAQVDEFQRRRARAPAPPHPRLPHPRHHITPGA